MLQYLGTQEQSRRSKKKKKKKKKINTKTLELSSGDYRISQWK